MTPDIKPIGLLEAFITNLRSAEACFEILKARGLTGVLVSYRVFNLIWGYTQTTYSVLHLYNGLSIQGIYFHGVNVYLKKEFDLIINSKRIVNGITHVLER